VDQSFGVGNALSASGQNEESHGELRREITTWGSFTWGYADVGADVYVALGLVLATAEGLANLAFLIAGLVYVTVGLAYTELAAAYPLAGGGQFFVLRGLGDFWGFIAGWAVLLDFTVDIALFAYSSAGYVNHFFPHLNQVPWIVIETCAMIVFLFIVNVSGVRESTRLNAVAAAIDITSETTLIFVGFLVAFSPELWWHQTSLALLHFDPSKLALGASLAIISFVGLESIAQAAQETVRPSSVMPRTSIALILMILAYALALSNLALGMVTWQTYDPFIGGHGCTLHLAAQSICQVHLDHENAPVPWLADNLPLIGQIIAPLVSILGAMLLLISSNTGVYGSSRIAYSMAGYQQLPRFFGQVSESRRTPVVALSIFSGIALLILLSAAFTPDILNTLGDVYAFGATTSYTLVFIAALRLRFVDPDTPRPFLMPWNVTVRYGGRPVQVSIVNLLGIVGIVGILVMVVITHPIGRIAGPIWILVGLVIYFFYRRKRGLPFPGSIERNWPVAQLTVYRESGEDALADEYEGNLAHSRRPVRQKTHV
jgi:APA family basic amino acid/polyamine antiporter